jgi:hypothetical protein
MTEEERLQIIAELPERMREAFFPEGGLAPQSDRAE